MPDEALKASLQGRPRQAPDFSPLALSHLHSSCLAVRQLIKQYLSTPTPAQLESLSLAVKDIHFTLQLLGRHGALLVTSELSLLIDAMAAKAIVDADACAHSLVFAGERLADYVAHLQRPGAVDSALPLLPVINNCRACRGEELYSEMLIVASGIDIPDASNLSLPTNKEIAAFINSVKASRQPLMRGLIGWFNDKGALNDSLDELSVLFNKLSEHCDAPTSLQPLVPLFDSAEFICQSVQKKGLDNSAALHKLFAQLERLLDGYSKLEIHDLASFAKPVPEHLFLNMLYYVALSSESTPKAVALRRRFRLDRFISRGINGEKTQGIFDGVGDRLTDSIRDAIHLETEAASAWLSDQQSSTTDLAKVSDRLSQLEPAILLLGAPESLRQLRLINAALRKFVAKGKNELKPQVTERTADSIVRLERALDAELNAVRAQGSGEQHSNFESILAGCLTEAQFQLLEIEAELIVMFEESVDGDAQAGGPLQAAKIAEVNSKFSMINSALQILPLPEVTPLISGVQRFITRHENQSLTRTAHRDLATVMVSLGYYLDSVLQPNGAAGQLLLEAEDALLKLDMEGQEPSNETVANLTLDPAFDSTHVINGGADGKTDSQSKSRLAQPDSLLGRRYGGHEGGHDVDRNGDHKDVGSSDPDNDPDYADSTYVDYTLDTEAESFIDVSLQQMGIINSTLFEYEQAGMESEVELRSAQRQTLVSAYTVLANEANACGSLELAQLAYANIRLLESGNDSKNVKTLLEESVAVLPQLIHQMHSSSDKVFGLQALLDQLNDAALDDLTLAMDVQSILTMNSTIDNIESLALGDDLAAEADPFSITSTIEINPDNAGSDLGGDLSTDFSTGLSTDLSADLSTDKSNGPTHELNHGLNDELRHGFTYGPRSDLADDFDETANVDTAAFLQDTLVGLDIESTFSDPTLASAELSEELDDTLVGLDGDLTTDDMSVMTLDNTLEQVFFRECDQHMLSLRKSVDDALSSSPWNSDKQRAVLKIATQKAGVDKSSIPTAVALPNQDMLRALHTLTGSAQTVDAKGVIAIAQPLQKAALQKHRNVDYFNRPETEYISELLDVLQLRLNCMEADLPFSDDNSAVMSRLQDFVARSEPWISERKPGLQLKSNVGTIESVFEEEARELLESLRNESQCLSDDEQRDDAIEQILRNLHTIKGSARMAGQLALADRAHTLEDEIRLADGVALDEAVATGLGELQTLLLVEVPATASQIDSSPTLDTASNSTSETGANATSTTKNSAINTAKSEDSTSAAVEPQRSEPMGLTEASFENLLSLATRATVSQAKLSESMLRLREACQDIESSSQRLQRLPHDNPELQSAMVAEMLDDLDNAQRMLADALLDAEAEQSQGSRADTSLHQTLIRAQLVSFGESLPRLSHAATDAGKETGKNIVFGLAGGELNIDKAMNRKLMVPLEHLIRNAVVHGIEATVEREASGKNLQGRVSVEAKIDGTDLLIEVSDDGVGIQPRLLLEKQDTKQGNMQSVPLSPDRILDILCESGFTTHTNADQLGGRGLGLSTVKQLVEELEGTLHLSLPPEGGSVFSLRIPQKIRINQVVLVEHQSRLLAIPVNFIHTVNEVANETANEAGSQQKNSLSSADIQFNGNDYQPCSLDAIVNGDIASNSTTGGERVILLGVHDKHIALLVDNVLGYREIMVQPLSAQLRSLNRYSGGAVLANGSQVLIPDFNRLVRPDSQLPAPNWSAANSSIPSKTALVVDDSITMRIAAEQTLQNLAIDTNFARDGAEAVDLITDSLPDVLLVDIDMPRMNGFDFLRHLSILHPQHTVPIIMISTRDSDSDREQASALGATHYLVKPYTESQLEAVMSEVGMLDNQH